MAKRQHSELAAGLFVIVALAAGVGVLLWLGAGDLFAKARQRAFFYVTTEFGSVGLKEGDFVSVNDAEVGQIAQVRYDAKLGRTYYVAEVERDDVKIHADGEAHVAAGLVGAGQLIVTKLGSADAPLADESSPIRISGGLAQAMKDLSAAVEVVRKQLDPNEKDALLSMILDIVAELKAQTDPKAAGSLMAKIHQSTDDVNAVSASFRREADPAVAGSLMAQVHTSAADVNAVSAALRKEADAADKASLLAKVHASADSVKSFTGDAAAMATKIRPDIEATLGKVREYTEKDLAFILAKLRTANTDLVTTVGNLKVISGEGRELIVLNRKQLQDTIVNLKVMSDNLAAAAKEIRRNPWRLLHRPGEKATANENIYDAARAFGEGAGQLSDAIATLKAAEDAKGVLQKDDPLLVKIRAHLEASYEKFSKAEKGLWDALKQ